MSNSDWLTIEKLVQTIEKSLSPDSSVEHDVKLPDLTSNSNVKRQCDIVITTGTPPRHTITIVEVQSRKSKFNITFFQGLVQKMRDVGAQHLICVSTEGFTKTIKQKAQSLGGTVRLVKLNKHDINNFPHQFANFKFIHSTPEYDFVAPPVFEFKKTGETEKELDFLLGDLTYILSSPEKTIELDIKQLIQHYFNIHDPKTDGVYKVKFPIESEKLSIRLNGIEYPLDKFEWDTSVKVQKQEVPVLCYSYEQEETGPIAWALEGTIEMYGKTNTIRWTINKENQDKFIVTGFEIIPDIQ